MSDDYVTELLHRAQTAEAQLQTVKDQYAPAIDRIQEFKKNFGVKERSNGQIDIDFDKFVERLGIEGWLELRTIGDERWRVSGEAGQKPRIKVTAA